jgi:putative DNA methylase
MLKSFRFPKPGAYSRTVSIRCASSTELQLAPESLDGVFTDPPYFGNVQYSELMDFCYVWLRRLVGHTAEGFDRESTRSDDEVAGNTTQARGLMHFTDSLAAVYGAMAHALKPGAPLAFTFHHNRIEAYHAVGVAILDAGLTCTAVLPCPAEMGGSIHIHGTGSSIVDTVFVCRHQAAPHQGPVRDSLKTLEPIIADELAQLRTAGLKPTAGDIRCIVFGQLTCMAIQKLHSIWDIALPTTDRLASFAQAVSAYGNPAPLIEELALQQPRVGKLVNLPLFAEEISNASPL